MHGTMSPGPPPSTLFSAREPMLPRERQRPSHAFAYPRFTQLLPPELTSLSLAEKRPPLAYSPTGCENPPRGDWVPRKVQQIPDYFTPCGFVVRAFLLVPK